MKKRIKVVVILLCLIIVTGCEKKSDKENNLEQELRFKSHPEEKYNWYWKYEKGADEEVVTFVDSSFEEFEKPDNEGYTGEQIYSVKGAKEGKTTIIYYTVELDKNNSHPSQTVKYEYVVDKDLNVSAKKVK